jgi:competence ComEA-like helix-hairpin-helix protein
MWPKVIATAHRFGFTKNETAVILFLSTALVAGSIIGAFDKNRTAPRKDFREEYRMHDSIFASMARCGGQQSADAFRGERSRKGLLLQPGSVNINSADARQLAALPGVGQATAELIVKYRSTYGPFASIEDILNVKTIGVKKFEKMKTYICVK